MRMAPGCGMFHEGCDPGLMGCALLCRDTRRIEDLNLFIKPGRKMGL